jgi:SAM-dependent methyltransferase
MSETVRTLTPQQIEEDKHWWFASRTWALLGMLDRVVPGHDGSARLTAGSSAGPALSTAEGEVEGLTAGLQVLDVGCGAGNMIHHLSRYGQVKGVEIDPRPIAVARQRGYEVEQGDATQSLPFEAGSFDLVAALDLIEHNKDDMAILRECYRLLNPGGHVVITVPAFMWLWSNNDVINAHVRRYTAGELRDKLQQVGFRIRRMTYNNFLVFPLAAALILARRGTEREPRLASHHLDEDEYQVEMEPVPPLLNAILSVVGWVEARILRWLNLPIGTSIICIAEKPR